VKIVSNVVIVSESIKNLLASHCRRKMSAARCCRGICTCWLQRPCLVWISVHS